MDDKGLLNLSKVIKRDKCNIPPDILTASISQPESLYTVEASSKYLYVFQTEKLPDGRYKRKKIYQAINKPLRSILFIAGYDSKIVITAQLNKIIFLSCSTIHVTLRGESNSCDFIRCCKTLVDCVVQPPSLNIDVSDAFKIYQRKRKGVYSVTASRKITLKLVNAEKNLRNMELDSKEYALTEIRIHSSTSL